MCLKKIGHKQIRAEKIGRLGEKKYFGIKWSYKKGSGRAIRSIEVHPPHNDHGYHLQINKWNPVTNKHTPKKRIELFKWLRRKRS